MECWGLLGWLPHEPCHNLHTDNRMQLHFTGLRSSFLFLLIGQEVSDPFLWERKNIWEEKSSSICTLELAFTPSRQRQKTNINSSQWWLTRVWGEQDIASVGFQDDQIILSFPSIPLLPSFLLCTSYKCLDSVVGEVHKSEFDTLIDTNSTVFLSSTLPATSFSSTFLPGQVFPEKKAGASFYYLSYYRLRKFISKGLRWIL